MTDDAHPQKKLLIVSEKFHPSQMTDSLLMMQLAEDLVRRGRPVTVLTSRLWEGRSRLPARENWNGVEIRRIRSLVLPGRSTAVKICNRMMLMMASFLYLPEFQRHGIVMCLSTPPLFPFLGALARKRSGPRFVFLLYDLYPEVAVLMGLTREKSLSFRLLDRIYRTVFRKADRVVCLGRDVQGYLAETKGVGPDRAVLIPNWADPRKTLMTEPRHVFRREHGLIGKLMLVYSGNMGLFHDFDTLLDAAGVLQAEGVDDIVFVFVGRGDQRERVEKLQVERGLRNVVLGDFLPEADHYDLLASADLLLSTLKPGAGRFSVPSKTYPYLVSGKPVIAIMDRSAEIALTLDEEKIGYTIEPGRYEALVALLHEIRRHPEQLAVMGARAREAGLRRFSREIVTLQYEEMFRTLDGLG